MRPVIASLYHIRKTYHLKLSFILPGSTAELQAYKPRRCSTTSSISPLPTQILPVKMNYAAANDSPLCSHGKQLTIFHFNDVYNIEPSNIEPVGGAARLMTAYKAIQHRHPMVLFSGDCLNPSMISSVEKGNQMLPVFNNLGLTCAVIGNHEFDFGLEVLENFMSKCTFPWLLSNVFDRCTGRPLADAHETYLVDWEGVKVGFVGLAEEEWLFTLPTLDITDMLFTDYVECGKNLTQRLRDQGADIVIALTHMSMKSDIHLLREVADIDMVLGGHDHHYCIEQVDTRYVVKSGSDFQNASVITLNISHDNSLKSAHIQEVTLDSSVPEDFDMKLIVSSYLDNFEEMSRSVLGYSDSDLDGLFEHVRTRETNLGNLVADIMVESTGADVAIINSGTLRSNCVHPKGAFSNKDLLRILPLFDQLCVLDVTGKELHETLENGVSRYPNLDGRFPQVSGIHFCFDSGKDPGHRIDRNTILVNSRPLQYDQRYKVCVKEYIARGRDGYATLRACPVIISSQAGPVLSTSVQNYFEGVVRPCKFRGCLHRHCSSEKSSDGCPVISHHQISDQGDTRAIPSVEGRIINTYSYMGSPLPDVNGNDIILS